ncbi:hypothetical protein HRbin33_01668 [bacterium HR33]|nr:hypothetical protein HRbin33_01668 [bacterium HR33]
MIATLLLALAAPLGAGGLADWGAWFSGDSPIEIWASKTHGLRHGDRVRLYARSERDGYLVVLHAEPSGRVRVLFPLDPLEDNYMRGGTSYELRGRGGREAFEIFDRSGYGTVLAAFSRDPFRFDAFMRGDHWDYTQLDLWRVSGDPEGHLLGLVDRMAMGRYDYDLLRYDVAEYVAYQSRPVRLSLYGAYWDDHYHGGVHVSVFLGSPVFYYRPYYRPVLFYPVPVYHYPPYYYAPGVFVAHWYDPFFDPYFPYYWYRPAYYVVYYPRYYYAYYAAYYPAYPYRTVPVRYAGGYTFKLGSQPSVIEPRRRAVLAEAVTRRLVSPDNFSAPAGSPVRRTVASERVVPRSAGAPGADEGRRSVGTARSPRGQPITGVQWEPQRRTIVSERAPAAGGGAPRRVEPREPDRRSDLGEQARRPVAAPSSDRSLEQMDRLRRLVPQARERVDRSPRSAGEQTPRPSGLDEVGSGGRRITDAVPPARTERELLVRREIRYNPPPPQSVEREGGGPQERARRSAPVIRESPEETERTEYLSPVRAGPRREAGSSLRIVPRGKSERAVSPSGWSLPYRAAEPVARPPSAAGASVPRGFPEPPRTVEPRVPGPAVAAPSPAVPRAVVPGIGRPPERAVPGKGNGRRKP